VRPERCPLGSIHSSFFARQPANRPDRAEFSGTAPPVAEPAIAEPGQLPLRPRPSLQAVGPTQPADGSSSKSRGPSNPGSDPGTVDLTAEDDTQTLPRLDSLEQKLKDLEQQFG
ncbi:hypothetical protein ABTZ98_30595, partial [Streptomyces bacillaris]